jgi:tetratricopeptide (TPR) repeat protein
MPDTEPETAPYVAKFVREARSALGAGRREEAERFLAKARALDERSPEVERLDRELREPERPDEFLVGGASFAEISDLGSAPSSEAGAGTGGDPRIAELLATGQAAFERGEHQNAIDAWSRVFLIDIDHAEAGRRIEEARRFKAEAERKAEELFQDGVARYEDGDRDASREIFNRLLAANPNHLAAREMLERLETARSEADEPARPAASRTPGARTRAAADVSEQASARRGKGKSKGVLKEEILVPPDPGQVREPGVAPVAEAGRAGRSRKGGRGVLLGAAAVLLVAAAAAWLWTQRDQLFPNRGAAPVTAKPLAGNALEQARRLHAEGKTSAAVARLRRLTPDDPLHQGAQALIAEWEALERPAPPALAPAAAARRVELLAAAQRALDERRSVNAAEWLRQAEAIAPLVGADLDLDLRVRSTLAPYAPQLTLFRQGEWEAVLPALWRLREADPENRDVTAMIVDSYFNLGVRELQRESPDTAIDKFREALALAPEDLELRRTVGFAEAYRSGNLDLQYRIFVKYLGLRGGAST